MHNQESAFIIVSDFSNFFDNLDHKNDYGIVQGSAISSVMSNIYMIKFDKIINDFITSNNGIYRRYSDDIIIIIPDITKSKEVYTKIMDMTTHIPRLIISDDKTKCFIKKNKKIAQIDLDKNEIIKDNAIINYLGFSYDGNIVKIKEKTVSKYYRKMYSCQLVLYN